MNALLLFGFIGTVLVGSSAIFKDESDLPVYLRGIGWNNAQAELRKDLRLSSSVRPVHYDLYLVSSVRGYDGANVSHFEGNVFIDLNITEPVREIELHSLGLKIDNVFLVVRGKRNNKILSETFSVNEERESIIIPSSRLILPGEFVIVQIEFRGTAKMDGGGFYESWNQREQSAEPPFISLLTHCEPAAARRWFPCFDEPDKKATFQLTVLHPKGTTAYSNTPVESFSEYDSMRSTRFEPTVPLPTYLLALAITEQPVMELIVDGYQFRAIGYNRNETVRAAALGLEILQNNTVFDGVPFFPVKTDILVVDDYTSGAMENPGLITFHLYAGSILEIHYFGNLVTLSTWDDIWVNEGFASFYDQDTRPASTLSKRFEFLSLHDLPMHADQRTFTASIHIGNSFNAQAGIHYAKGSQVLRMIKNFVGAEVFDRAIKNYLLDNAFGNGDATKIIDNLLDEYHGDSRILHKMLYEWIYQPGVAVIFVERDEQFVTLRQKRFHSSYFDAELRDDNTRFTIPLFCEIDGKPETIVLDSEFESLKIPLHANSTFTIEDDYGNLFGVWTPLTELPETWAEQFDWLRLSENLYLSGLISLEKYIDALTPFAADAAVQLFLRRDRAEEGEDFDVWAERESNCKEMGVLNASIEEILTLYHQGIRAFFDDPAGNVDIFFCSKAARNREAVKRMLHDKIIADTLKFRNNELARFIMQVEFYHPDATMEFVMEELERDPTSLALRLKLHTIIRTVFNPSKDLSTLHDFIRSYPRLAAESSDSIAKILEMNYLRVEHDKKRSELAKAVDLLLKDVPEADTKNIDFEAMLKKTEKQQSAFFNHM